VTVHESELHSTQAHATTSTIKYFPSKLRYGRDKTQVSKKNKDKIRMKKKARRRNGDKKPNKRRGKIQ
jgi:hypothetical protein